MSRLIACTVLQYSSKYNDIDICIYTEHKQFNCPPTLWSLKYEKGTTDRAIFDGKFKNGGKLRNKMVKNKELDSEKDGELYKTLNISSLVNVEKGSKEN